MAGIGMLGRSLSLLRFRAGAGGLPIKGSAGVVFRGRARVGWGPGNARSASGSASSGGGIGSTNALIVAAGLGALGLSAYAVSVDRSVDIVDHIWEAKLGWFVCFLCVCTVCVSKGLPRGGVAHCIHDNKNKWCDNTKCNTRIDL